MVENSPPRPNVHHARNVIATIRQQTGRQYTALETEMGSLSVQALQDLVRLLRDLESNKTNAVRQAQMQPWRR